MLSLSLSTKAGLPSGPRLLPGASTSPCLDRSPSLLRAHRPPCGVTPSQGNLGPRCLPAPLPRNGHPTACGLCSCRGDVPTDDSRKGFPSPNALASNLTSVEGSRLASRGSQDRTAVCPQAALCHFQVSRSWSRTRGLRERQSAREAGAGRGFPSPGRLAAGIAQSASWGKWSTNIVWLHPCIHSEH